MKAQLVVVQGKPEGKIIPLAISQFKIGRGEGCQLRPNHDQVSREHAMFEVTSDAVFIQDLGSRNGTEVNGKKLGAHDPFRLTNGDLVKVGPLTFAVSIEGAVVAAVGVTPKKSTPIDHVSHDEIDTWLVSDPSKEPPERPSGVFGGDTISIETFKIKEKTDSSMAVRSGKTSMPAPAAKAPVTAPTTAPAPTPVPAPAAKAPAAKASKPEPVPEEIEAYREEEEDDGIEDLSQSTSSETEDDVPEDMIDESNPFYVKKKTEAAPVAAAKGPQKDSSDAANDILRRMMDRRKASKST